MRAKFSCPKPFTPKAPKGTDRGRKSARFLERCQSADIVLEIDQKMHSFVSTFLGRNFH